MTKKKGRIALIGSGELTPTMVEVHKELLRGKGRKGLPPQALFLDTPAGFQPNADEISAKAASYFRQNIQQELSIVSFKSTDAVSEYDRQTALQQIKNADYLLMGPGSPTYAVGQLSQTPIPDMMTRFVQSGGSLAIASAAALTAGRHTLPVYEIYKVGQDLHWVDGLDILGRFGMNLVVIPHWNNADGGTHDTHCCYVGRDRFTKLEQLLPENTLYIGIDEHTACIMEFENDVAIVKGQGRVILRQQGREIIFSKGDSFSLQKLKVGLQRKKARATLTPKETVPPSSPAVTGTISPGKRLQQLDLRFRQSVSDHDFQTSVNTLLELDKHIDKTIEQSTPLPSTVEQSIDGSGVDIRYDDTIAGAKETFRECLLHLGAECKEMQHQINERFVPLVENILQLRTRYKQNRQWPEADALRDLLHKSRILVQDTKSGVQWRIMKDDE